ncbi:hypothetical protein HZB78_00925 [Candidatus Collierbacteria bacterium]|nr:hypothetical protein [Candidatus Collierbacteria bacterium]
MERLAPLARTKKDFMGTPPDMPDNLPHIDIFSDEELSDYFTKRLFVQGEIGLNGERFPSITQENLKGIRDRTIASLRFDVEYAQLRGRPVPIDVLRYFENS